ncbi:hypothetical protein HC248_02682 [Polaromonas vacuolata]|uniref:Uncharacterized protein n=1 Tax=Polaromonas vacuolata TaxID=37448 RepID=A0A6H2HC71_9BURK|nr:hypothetical protein HC248_02682 [Polaromonas vacuolata]
MIVWADEDNHDSQNAVLKLLSCSQTSCFSDQFNAREQSAKACSVLNPDVFSAIDHFAGKPNVGESQASSSQTASQVSATQAAAHIRASPRMSASLSIFEA